MSDEFEKDRCEERHANDRELIRLIESRYDAEKKAEKELINEKLENIMKTIPDGTLFNRTMTFRQGASAFLFALMISISVIIGFVRYVLPFYKASIEASSAVSRIEKDNEKIHGVLDKICDELDIEIKKN